MERQADQAIEDNTIGLVSRRKLMGWGALLASLLAIPHWIYAAVTSPIDALRRIFREKADVDRFKVEELASALHKKYGLQPEIASVKITPQSLPPRFRDGHISIDGGRESTQGIKPVDLTKLATLKFADGTMFSDANGNSQLDVFDFNLDADIEFLQEKFNLKSLELAGKFPTETFHQKIEKVVQALQIPMPYLEDQRFFPLTRIAGLYAQAWHRAEDGGTLGRQGIKDSLEQFISHLRTEAKLRAKAEKLEFFAESEEDIKAVALEQARIFNAILDHRENRVLPLLNDLAEAIGSPR